MALLQLLALRYEETKETLVSCDDTDIQGFRGMALGLRRLIHELTVNPPPLPSKETYT